MHGSLRAEMFKILEMAWNILCMNMGWFWAFLDFDTPVFQNFQPVTSIYRIGCRINFCLRNDALQFETSHDSFGHNFWRQKKGICNLWCIQLWKDNWGLPLILKNYSGFCVGMFLAKNGIFWQNWQNSRARSSNLNRPSFGYE